MLSCSSTWHLLSLSTTVRCQFVLPISGGLLGQSATSTTVSHLLISVIFILNFLSPNAHHHASVGQIDPRIQLVQLPSATIHQSHSQYTIINVTKGEQYQEIDCLLRNTQCFDSVFASLGMESLDVLSGGQSPCVA